MLKIKTLSVGQLKTNCYIAYDDKTLEAVIIDPGDDADYVGRIISDLNLIPIKILATHGHFDHILATTELKLYYNIPFLIHKSDEFLIKNMKSSAKHFIGITTDPPPIIDSFFEDNDKIQVGSSTFSVIHTPGHTPGSVCLNYEEGNTLFVGDLIFEDGAVGRTDFSYSDQKDLNNSISKILKLDKYTTANSGHGDSFLLKDWKTQQVY